MLLLWVAVCSCCVLAQTTQPASGIGTQGGNSISNEAQRRLSYYYMAALRQKSLENYTAMADLLRHCLEIDPNNPAANFDLAMVYLTTNDTTGLRMLQHAVANDPNNPWFKESLASIYLSMHKMDEAVPVLEEMSKLQTKRTDVLAQLFQLYKTSGRTKDAINALDRIQTLQGNSTRIAGQKYALYLDLGDTIQAFEQLRSLCREFPYDATGLILLGDQYMTVQQYDSAMVAYSKAERIDPQNTMLQTSRLQYPLLTGDTLTFRHLRDSVIVSETTDLELRINAIGSLAREALQDSTMRPHAEEMFDRLLSPDKPAVQFLQLYLTYKAYSENASNEDLLPIMERILYVDPANTQIASDMLQYYAMQADFERIESLCQKTLIYNPSELVFHYFLGVSLAQQKKNEEAIAALTTATRQIDEESSASLIGDIYGLLGDMQHEMHREKEAFEAYDSCLVYAPDNVACLNNYAYYLSLKNEQLERAEQMSYRTIKAEPDNKTYLDTYAWILFMQQDYTTARIYMDRVIDPKKDDTALMDDDEANATLLEHAGDIYVQCGQTEMAVRYWTLALKKADKKNSILAKKIKKRKYIKK